MHRPHSSRQAARWSWREPVRTESCADGGYGLVEVLLSLTLFMVLAATATPALLTAVRFSESNENRVVAAGLAAAQIEQARAVPAAVDLVAGNSTVQRNGATFAISRRLLPASGCPDLSSRTITVTVTWAGGVVRSDTLRICRTPLGEAG